MVSSVHEGGVDGESIVVGAEAAMPGRGLDDSPVNASVDFPMGGGDRDLEIAELATYRVALILLSPVC